VFFQSFVILAQTTNFEHAGAGVTIIVHGWNPNGIQPIWMNVMANEIIAKAGGNGQIATITVTGSQGNLVATCSNWNFNLSNSTSAEIVVLVNWTSVSNHLTTGITAQSVAAVVTPKIYQSQNGQIPLSEMPIHLIGHSRGGGMVSEITRLLGLQGIEVEHLTTLDPHPLTNTDPQGLNPPFGPGQTIDTPVQIYENVLFADNYYQTIEYPKGQMLNGAYNRLWTNLPGGYHNETGYTFNISGTSYNFSDHLNVILMYHGTIDLDSIASNGEATITQTERNLWYNTYEDFGANTGFVYCRIIGNDRMSSVAPVVGGNEIIDGYNQELNGNGIRQILNWTNAVWPNIITIDFFKNTNKILSGIINVNQNDTIDIQYSIRSYANATNIKFFLDNDRNPYNQNNVIEDTLIFNSSAALTGNNIVNESSLWANILLTCGNKYYVCSEINDGNHIRYMYAPYEIIYTLGYTGITLEPQNQTNICPNTNVIFSITGINIENYQWQTSTNSGLSWSNLSDNFDYTGSTTDSLYVLATSQMNGNLYRCICTNTNGSDTSNFAILTTDELAPVPDIALLADITAQCEVNSLIPPSATDNCTGSITGTHNITLPIIIQGITVVTWTYNDGNGNTSTQLQNVIISDTTLPVINCNSNQIINLSQGENYYTVVGTEFDPIQATDNCGTVGILNDFNNQASLYNEVFPIDTTEITWTITDIAGNNSSCSFNVIINSYLSTNYFYNDVMSISPNPSTGVFMVDFEIVPDNIIITNVLGETIFQTAFLTNSKIQINLTNHIDGIYFIKSKFESKTTYSKIIKCKN